MPDLSANPHPFRRASRFLLAAFAANFAVFLFMAAHGDGAPGAAELVRFGGNYGPSVAQGQYWRLLTAVFVHGGAAHLLWNSLGLFMFCFIRNPFDELQTASIYLLSGIAGNVLGTVMHPTIVSVGASGAILGLFAAVIGNILRIGDADRRKEALSMSLQIIIPTLLVIGGHADFAGHLGGTVAGFALGYRMTPAKITFAEAGSGIRARRA